MRSGFTLIELMIVIAIIAIVAAIAVPNLLESRITAAETAAATALRTGILPAEVQFQSGGYEDPDGNGVGSFSTGVTAYDTLSGGSPISGITLTLLPPAYRGAEPVIGGFRFQAVVSATTADLAAERTWAVASVPVDVNSGRRQFLINQAGRVYASVPTITAATAVDPLGILQFGVDATAMPSTSVWRAYSR